MPDITLESFKQNLIDAARPNRFFLTINSPVGGNGEVISYTVKGASIPGRSIGEVEMNWQGMKSKVAGDPTWDDFTVTFINDMKFEARNMIERWMRLKANPLSNARTSQDSYKREIQVEQLGRNGDTLAGWILYGAHPKIVDQIDLSQDNQDMLEEFTVTFAYDYWERP